MNAERTEDGSPREGQKPATFERILEGAERALAINGLRATSMEHVARAAGLTRMTVYRYFASRDELMQAIVDREMRRYFETLRGRARAVEAATPPGENPVPRVLVDTFQSSMRYFDEHPVVNAMRDRDPELLNPFWTSQADLIFRMTVEAIAPGLERWRDAGWIRPLPVDEIAEWLTRLSMSWLTAKSTVTDPHDEDVMRGLVENYVWPVLDPRPRT